MVVVFLCTVSGSGDAIVAPEAPIREQFYKEIDFMHRKWPDVKKSGLFSNFSPIPTIKRKSLYGMEQAINEPGGSTLVRVLVDCFTQDDLGLPSRADRAHACDN